MKKLTLLTVLLLAILPICCTSCKKADDESVVSDTEKSVLRSSAVGDAWAKLVDNNEFGAIDVISELGYPIGHYSVYNYYFDHVTDINGITALIDRLKSIEDHVVNLDSDITAENLYEIEDLMYISQGTLIFLNFQLKNEFRMDSYIQASDEGNDFISVHFMKDKITISTDDEFAAFQLDCDTTDIVSDLQKIYDSYKLKFIE